MENKTIVQQLNWRNLKARFMDCLRDERGAVMEEYAIITGSTVPLACFLYHPDNGFYKAAHDQHYLTTLLLMFPGP